MFILTQLTSKHFEKLKPTHRRYTYKKPKYMYFVASMFTLCRVFVFAGLHYVFSRRIIENNRISPNMSLFYLPIMALTNEDNLTFT